MNTESILFDTLHTLYPQVTMDIEGIVMTILYLVLAMIALFFFITSLKEKEIDLSIMLTLITAILLGVSYMKHTAAKDRAIDRMI